MGERRVLGRGRRPGPGPVARLRDPGTVILGKTRTPEFSVDGHTASDAFGATRNPWNPALTPGGSSGGSAAAVAAGLAAAGIGTDGGGSVRRPAGHPAITVPAAPDADGMPIGVQVIGDLFAEATLLDLAERCDAAGPGWRRPALAER